MGWNPQTSLYWCQECGERPVQRPGDRCSRCIRAGATEGRGGQ